MVHPNIPTPNLAAHAAATGQELAPHPPRTEYLATLSKHTAPVNVVRFSPNGQTLASAGDGELLVCCNHGGKSSQP
jgi:chromatin assembly factor 1 subunit B